MQRDNFFSEIGTRLARLGFPEKINKRYFLFKKPTPIGSVGLFVFPENRIDSIDFRLQCAVSVSSVQEQLLKTELFVDTGGLTWTCGALLKEMRRYQGHENDVPSWKGADGKIYLDMQRLAEVRDEFGTDDGYIRADDTDDLISQSVDKVFERFSKYGWPTLEQHGNSEEAFLNLTLRTDKVAELMFLDPVKPLAGLILAKRLGRDNARSTLLRNAKSRYKSAAKYGNPDLLEQFYRIGKVLGLVDKTTFPGLGGLKKIMNLGQDKSKP